MKKVGIVTFNNVYNYGAFLQAYALKEALEELNYEAHVINYVNPLFDIKYKYEQSFAHKAGMKDKLELLARFVLRRDKWKKIQLRAEKFESAMEKDLNLSQSLNENIANINEEYDFFIAGSDQVWNLKITEGDTTYFLDFVKDDTKKLSYAASFGKANFTDMQLQVMKEHLKDYKRLLIREKTGQELLSEELELESDVVLDPTLLIDREGWQDFAGACKVTISNYLLLYVIQQSAGVCESAVQYAKAHNLEIVVLNRIKKFDHSGVKVHMIYDADPYDFVNYIIHADVVFTTSFHGMCFSINLNKQFYYELSKAKENNNARLIDLAEIMGVEKQEIIDGKVVEHEIGWDAVNERLNLARTESIALLRDMIEK